MPRLRRSDCSGPGIRRRGRGRGFEYIEDGGERVVDKDTIERIRELGIPPAWKDVWICSDPHGHIQATGIDAAGRTQYRYHDRWRERRDQEKFDEMVAFAAALPQMRKRVGRHLRRPELDRLRVLACSVRLLDRGFFRIGGEEYAADNKSYGLATMHKQHVTLEDDGALTFDYPAKSGQRRVHSLVDPVAYEIVKQLKRRRGGSPELLAYREDGRWVDVEVDRHQRLHQGGRRRGVLGQGLPHLERDRPHRGRARGHRHRGGDEDRARARDHPGDQAGRRVPRQHARRLPRVLRRPARARPLPRRA